MQINGVILSTVCAVSVCGNCWASTHARAVPAVWRSETVFICERVGQEECECDRVGRVPPRADGTLLTLTHVLTLLFPHALSSPSVSTPPSTSPSWCRCMLAHSPLAMNYYSSDLSYYAARNDESFYDQQQPQQRTERESPLAEPASGPSAASYTGGYKDEPDTPG